MKVAIITLTKMYNYGNSLQCYAVQEVLRANGMTPETVIYEYRTYWEQIKDKIKKSIRYGAPLTQRKILFDRFEGEYIVCSKFKNLVRPNARAEKYYEYYFVGSDQVWNAVWFDKYPFMKDAYLLTFTENKKKIAYSASFGIDYIPDKWNAWFKDNLRDFKAISVREKTGKLIVDQLTERKAERLIDPTMMLDADEWRKIAKKPQDTLGKYVLTYFLSPKGSNATNLCGQLSDEYEILDIMDGENYGRIGPSEFIWLVDHAEIILTDSFHGSVFSVLFNKPFCVFERQNADVDMNTRLISFLSIFGLERKYVQSNLENDLWEHDYRYAYNALDNERRKTNEFICKAISYYS